MNDGNAHEEAASRYADIIDHPYCGTATRPHMTLHARAAQFAPFAALSGHDEAIHETARLTACPPELTDDEQTGLSAQLALLRDNLPATVEVTFFQADSRKEGGAYLRRTMRVRRISEAEGMLIPELGSPLPIADIVALSGTLFNNDSRL